MSGFPATIDRRPMPVTTANTDAQHMAFVCATYIPHDIVVNNAVPFPPTRAHYGLRFPTPALPPQAGMGCALPSGPHHYTRAALAATAVGVAVTGTQPTLRRRDFSGFFASQGHFHSFHCCSLLNLTNIHHPLHACLQHVFDLCLNDVPCSSILSFSSTLF